MYSWWPLLREMDLETGIRPKKKIFFFKNGLGLPLQPDLVVSSGIPAMVLCVSWPCPYFGVLHVFIFVSEQTLPEATLRNVPLLQEDPS